MERALASVQSMDPNMRLRLPRRLRSSRVGRFLPVCATVFFLPFILNAQTTPASQPGSAAATPVVPAIHDSLRPALEQVGSALNQVQVDRWKLSHDLKAQVHSDVSSIQQDLSSQLPALFQAAQQSPVALEPQLSVMHNVDALYDVLVRIATTANISGGKTDAAILDNALQRLESARKISAGQLMQAVSAQDQQIARFRASIQAAESSGDSQPKTIVVNNSDTHRKRHRKAAPRHKVAPAVNTPAGTATPPPAAP